MTSEQQAAWGMLGWSETSWNGDAEPPLSDGALWKNLSPGEAAAARFGLGYTPESWDAELLEGQPGDGDALAASSSSSSSSVAAAGAGLRKGSGVLGALFGALRSGAELVDQGFDVARDPAGGLADALLAGPAVPVDGPEAIVYLDDSGSMASARHLASAHAAFAELAPRLACTPTRVVLFGTSKEELVPRTAAASPPPPPPERARASAGSVGRPVNVPEVLGAWRGRSGGTYLWHMIERDVLKRYRPGAGTLRIYVVRGECERPCHRNSFASRPCCAPAKGPLRAAAPWTLGSAVRPSPHPLGVSCDA